MEPVLVPILIGFFSAFLVTGRFGRRAAMFLSWLPVVLGALFGAVHYRDIVLVLIDALLAGVTWFGFFWFIYRDIDAVLLAAEKSKEVPEFQSYEQIGVTHIIGPDGELVPFSQKQKKDRG